MSQIGDFVKALEAAAEVELQKIEAVAVNFAHEIEADVIAFVGGEAVKLEQLAAPALQFVLAEAPKVLTGQEKFGNAVVNLVQWVEAQNWGVFIKDAEMAVQAAFRKAQEAARSLT